MRMILNMHSPNNKALKKINKDRFFKRKKQTNLWLELVELTLQSQQMIELLDRKLAKKWKF